MSVPSSALGVLLPGFPGPRLPAWLGDRLEQGLAGLCLFGSNIESPERLRALTDEVRGRRPGVLLAVDEEGGDVTRLHARDGAPDAGNAWLGRRDDLACTAAAAVRIAGELATAGINLNLAPDVDVNADPRNPVIGVRSFGADPDLVARHSAAWVAAHEAAGVATCPKHFPGHGDTNVDSHVDLPVVTASADLLERRDLLPFAAAIAAGAGAVMTSHLVVPALDPVNPATFSTAILVDLLRGRLGFEGVVVSDALDMAGASAQTGIPEAAVRALAAGCDLLCLGSDIGETLLDEIVDAITAAVESGRLDPSRLDDAAARVRHLSESLTAVGRSASGSSPSSAELAASFDITVEGQRLLDGVRASGASWQLVQLEAAPNIAAGSVPWGPGALTPACHVSSESVATLATSLDPGPVVVVGRDIARLAWQAAVVDDLRATRPKCLVVEMGSVDPDGRYADVVTHGGSRALGAALLELLGPARPGVNR